MNKVKKVIKLLLALSFCVCLGIISGMTLQTLLNKPNYDPFEMADIQSMPNASGVIEKIKVRDVLIGSVTDKSELVTAAIELIQELQMDQSFTDWDVFKKTQDIVYHGTCKYSTDLSSFTTDDIYFHPDGKSIDITVPKPVINSLEIHENDTYIKNTDNGLLRFGEIKLTAFDENEVRKTVKDRMLLEVQSPEQMKMAEEKTAKAVAELFGTCLDAAGFMGYRINVLFR